MLADWAALTAKQWRDGDPSFKCTLLAGNMSTDTLLAWLKDFETKRAQTLVRADGTKLFSKSSPKDANRQARRLSFLEGNLFTDKMPEKHDRESKDDRKALNGELERTREQVFGWACNFVLHTACTRDVRAQVERALTVAATTAGTKPLATTYGDWAALKTALLADHGPEPNFVAFNAPAFAWEVYNDPHAGDESGRLMSVMREASQALKGTLGGIHLDMLDPPPSHLRAVGRRGGTPHREVSDDGGDDSVAGEEQPPPAAGGAPAAQQVFTRADVVHYVNAARDHIIAAVVLGHHMGVTVDVNVRRELQQVGRVLQTNGRIAFVDPFAKDHMARAACQQTLNEGIRTACTAYCTRKTPKLGTPTTTHDRRRDHRPEPPRPAAVAHHPEPSTGAGTAVSPTTPAAPARALVTMIAEAVEKAVKAAVPPKDDRRRSSSGGGNNVGGAKAGDKSNWPRRSGGSGGSDGGGPAQICWHCDATGPDNDRKPKPGTVRCGHTTKECPNLARCPTCGRKHLEGWCRGKKKGVAKKHPGPPSHGPTVGGGAHKRGRY